MFSRMLNEMEIVVAVEGKSPLLVKDGRYTQDEKRAWAGNSKDHEHAMPAMVFISRSPMSKLKEVMLSCVEREKAQLSALDYYLPGSSVRGAWRSHLERVLRSLDGRPKVCDPLVAEKGKQPELPQYMSCSDALVKEDQERPEVPYLACCPVCRLFGNAAIGSRLAFSDGKRLRGEPALIDGIAISRFTGSVAQGANYRVLALRNAKFEVTLRLRNFELWHVGLLARLFDDLKEERVALGSGKNRGFGAVHAEASKITVTYYGLGDAGADGTLKGVAEHPLADDTFRNRYDLEVAVPPQVSLGAVKSAGWRHTRSVGDPSAVGNFWAATCKCFNQKVWDGLPFLDQREGLRKVRRA